MDTPKNNYLVFNQATIDKLFKCTNPADCFALYGFYYKTAKWQKTDTVKANNLYVKKSLSWGMKRISGAKKQLKDLGLISIIQQRKDNKVSNWYVKVSFIVTSKQSKVAVHNYNTQNDIVESNNTQKQQYPKATMLFQETDACKLIDICLKTVSLNKLPDYFQEIAKDYDSHKKENNMNVIDKSQGFDNWYSYYLRKKSKQQALKFWIRDKLYLKEQELIDKLILQNKTEYSNQQKQFIPHPSTYLNGKYYENEIEAQNNKSNNEQFKNNKYETKGMSCLN